MATINSFIPPHVMDKMIEGQKKQNRAILFLDMASVFGILTTVVFTFIDSPILSSVVGIIGAIWFADLLVSGRVDNSLLTSLTSRIGPLMAARADRQRMEKLTNTGMMLNSASYLISWIFTVLFLLNIAAIIEIETAKQSPLWQAATEKVSLAEDALTNHQSSRFKNNAQISADLSQHAQILAQIENIKQKAILENASALSAWQDEVSIFWKRPHPSGQRGGNRNIMNDDCVAEKSTFKNSKGIYLPMTTAAKKLCIEWRKIQAKEPTINLPEITVLKAKLVPLETSINFRNTELALKNAVANSYDALAVVETNIGLDKLPANGIIMVTAFIKSINPNIDDFIPVMIIILIIATIIVLSSKFNNQVIPELKNPRLMSNADIIAFEKNTEEAVKTTWKDWLNNALDIVRNIKAEVQTFSVKKKMAALVSFITTLLLGLFLVKSYAVAAPLNAGTNLFFTTLVCSVGIVLLIFWLIWTFIKPVPNNGSSGLIIDHTQPVPSHEPPDKPLNGSSDELFVNWNFVNEWTEKLIAYQPLQDYSQSGNVQTGEQGKPKNIDFLVPTEGMPTCKWCKKPMADGGKQRKYHPECAKEVKNAAQKKRRKIMK